MYAHEWLVANGRATNVHDWARIQAWEKSLPTDDHAAWRALTALRNVDIHEQPIVPYRVHRGGWDGGWMGEWTGGWNGGALVREVANPRTGGSTSVLAIAEGGLRAVRNLLSVYQTL